MKVLITGAGGMLGQAALAEFRRRGHDVIGLTRQSLDVTNPDQVRAAMEAHRPDVVLQCAAYTAVDAAESEPDEARRVNARGAELVAGECKRAGAKFVYPSTDYVFSGDSRTAWKPTDDPAPLNRYGESKLAGEEAARAAGRSLVVRTSWLYGSGGRNFVDTILRLAGERPKLEVVNDQIGLPTWTGSLAWVIAEMLEADVDGIVHACDAGDPVSWFEFARNVLAIRGLSTPVVPIPSEAYRQAAKRPTYSVLDCSETESILGRELPRREESLVRYLGRGAIE